MDQKKKRRGPKSLARRRLKDALRLAPIFGPLIVTAFIYAWLHTRLNIVGLPIESLRARKTDLIKQNDSIRLRIEKLQAPQRIEALAHQKLGMSLPKKWQVVALDESIQPPESTDENSRRAAGKPVLDEKPDKQIGFLKKRGNSGCALPKKKQSEAIPQSG